jgi:hypothetical protein
MKNPKQTKLILHENSDKDLFLLLVPWFKTVMPKTLSYQILFKKTKPYFKWTACNIPGNCSTSNESGFKFKVIKEYNSVEEFITEYFEELL